MRRSAMKHPRSASGMASQTTPRLDDLGSRPAAPVVDRGSHGRGPRRPPRRARGPQAGVLRAERPVVSMPVGAVRDVDHRDVGRRARAPAARPTSRPRRWRHSAARRPSVDGERQRLGKDRWPSTTMTRTYRVALAPAIASVGRPRWCASIGRGAPSYYVRHGRADDCVARVAGSGFRRAWAPWAGPSTRSPTMLRWISAVPPQIVSEREKKKSDCRLLTG